MLRTTHIIVEFLSSSYIFHKQMLSWPLVSDTNGIGSVLCLLHRIMAGRGQFQIVDTVCDCVCVTCVQVSFVTLVCSPSMSVIIADLAKRWI